MKYVILLGDGMADYQLPELQGRTPLDVAHKPNMDELARKGVGGLLRTVPTGMGAGSDVANISILGYDPRKYYTGRGPLEAASIGVDLKSGEIAFRCNLITVKDGYIDDYSAGHISNREAEELIKHLNHEFDLGRYYPGVSYRNLFVTGSVDVETTPPHDVLGQRVDDHLPRNDDEDPQAELLRRMILDSRKVLEDHPVNRARLKKGLKPANMIWLWGQGGRPSMESFQDKMGLKGAVISAVDLIKGIGILAGLEIIEVPDVTGLLNTNWKGKAEHALNALETVDFVYVHVEAIDEASHSGNVEEKIKAIESFDQKLIGPLLDGIEYPCRIALLPDHYTPIPVRTHTSEPVPYVISGGSGSDGFKGYSEKEIEKKGSCGLMDGHELLKNLFY